MAILQHSLKMTLPSSSPSTPSSSSSSSSSSSKTTTFINYAKESGRCTPSLLPTTEDEKKVENAFLSLVSNLVEDSSVSFGLSLKNNSSVLGGFQQALEMAKGSNLSTEAKILSKRRAILLLIICSTPTNNESLKYLLNSGLLVHVKTWLEDILGNRVGGVDLLLHLLSSICELPVSKDMVTSSKLGKQVAAVEKHKICVGGMNTNAIKERVAKVKELWSASVKRLKQKGAATSDKKKLKRSLETTSNTSVKKSRTGDAQQQSSSLSSLLAQVSGSKKIELDARKKAAERESAKNVAKVNSISSTATSKEPTKPAAKIEVKNDEQRIKKRSKKSRRIKWADHEGGPISVFHDVERDNKRGKGADGKVSWKDRKKRDRLKEKELIQKARKFKLVDKDDSLDTMAMIFSSKWHQPRLLPPDAENPPVEVNSQEVRVQTRRMASVMPVNYLSEDDVPQNPYPLTEAEQTMDLNAQSAAVPQTIPFFFSQQPPAAAPAPLPLPIHIVPAIPAIPAIPTIPPPLPVHIPAPPMMAPPPSVATIEVVRSMGLPDFLVGQNIQALQALIASPELLNSFRDVNGNYDQIQILNLIHALNQQLQKSNTNLPPFPPPIAQTPAIPPMPPTFGHYGSAQVPQYAPIPQASASYKPPSKLSSNGYRGDQNNTDGNLHLSGYGPNTSTDTLVAMFAPYVKVVEVVPKSGFIFLNTNDPEGAKRAREALNGMMIDGAPLRINLALRRNKNAAGTNSSSSMNAGASNAAHLPRNALGQIDFDAVRDDRGNPATKNLFVAGYGPGTTEQQLRDVFNQHTKVTGVVMKGSFSFVNNLEKSSAVIARQALVGTNLNGGSLRINFAKESGRLGTSFDTGYGNGNANRGQHQLPHQHQPVPNHYGHNKY